MPLITVEYTAIITEEIFMTDEEAKNLDYDELYEKINIENRTDLCYDDIRSTKKDGEEFDF